MRGEAPKKILEPKLWSTASIQMLLYAIEEPPSPILTRYVLTIGPRVSIRCLVSNLESLIIMRAHPWVKIRNFSIILKFLAIVLH